MLDLAWNHVVGIHETVDGFNVMRKDEITQEMYLEFIDGCRVGEELLGV